MINLHAMLIHAVSVRDEWREKVAVLYRETDAAGSIRVPVDPVGAEERYASLHARLVEIETAVGELVRLVDDVDVWLDEQTVPVRKNKSGRSLVFGSGTAGVLVPIALPGRVAKSIHAEFELRYLAPADWKPPKKLAGFKRGQTQYLHQRNRYYEAFSADAPDGILQAAGCSFRVRETHDTTIATLKIKPPNANVGARTKRLEVEHPMASREPQPGEAAFDIASELCKDTRLIEQFTVSTFRMATLYTDDRGNCIEIAQDYITYPDGTTENRLEAEVVAGKPKLLKRIEKALLETGPLTAAPRGKRAEARRRLHLGVAPSR